MTTFDTTWVCGTCGRNIINPVSFCRIRRLEAPEARLHAAEAEQRELQAMKSGVPGALECSETALKVGLLALLAQFPTQLGTQPQWQVP